MTWGGPLTVAGHPLRSGGGGGGRVGGGYLRYGPGAQG